MTWTHKLSRKGNIYSAWERGCRMLRSEVLQNDDKSDAFELGFPDVEWEEGQMGHSRCKVV